MSDAAKLPKGRWHLFAVLLLFGALAHAYPENIRHGYVNCTSCHVSPTGGGALTPYGRGLSSELMSTWSYKNEEGFLHGAIKEEQMPEWLMIGGDVRVGQTYNDTPTFTEKRLIWMQEDFEVAVKHKQVTLDLEFGHIEDPGRERWGSRRYFAMLNLTDEVTARVGRFYPQFGINVADHYVPTRATLGFQEGQERDNAELAWNGENWSAFATVSQQPGEIPQSSREKSGALQLNRNIADSSKVGASVWYGTSDVASRKMLGLHALAGFTKRLFLLSEVDHQWLTAKATDAETRGIYMYSRLGYEITKGLIAFGQAEYTQSDLTRGGGERDAYGPGLQWFPRPHFELVATWRKLRTRTQGTAFGDYGFLLGHYYF